MTGPIHQQTAGQAGTQNIPDHPARAESAAFRASKALTAQILATLPDGGPYGKGAIQEHHGGSLPSFDGNGWFYVLNPLGVEWSAQWAAAPDRIDWLRRNAVRHYRGFPRTVPQMEALGYADAATILSEPITDADGIARFVDSVFNSCLPIPAPAHVGIVTDSSPVGGVHEYPKPLCDVQHLVRTDFVLWVPVAKGHAAVAPVAPRGSGDGRVMVLGATPGTRLHKRVSMAHALGAPVILPAHHAVSKAAFLRQTTLDKSAEAQPSIHRP